MCAELCSRNRRTTPNGVEYLAQSAIDLVLLLVPMLFLTTHLPFNFYKLLKKMTEGH